MADWQELIPRESYPPLPDGVDEESFLSALDTIRDSCGWHIWPRITQTIQLEHDGGRLILLPSTWVESVASVTQDGREQKWRFIPESCSLLVPWVRAGSVTVTFTHGYIHVPRPVVAVAKTVAQVAQLGIFSQMTAGPFNISPPRGSEGGAAALNEYQITALAPYRIGPRPW